MPLLTSTQYSLLTSVGSTDDSLFQYLTENYSGTIDDMFAAFLRDQGLSGSVSDMVSKWDGTFDTEILYDQVLTYTGDDALTQALPSGGIHGGTLSASGDTPGFWMACYLFYDGSTWGEDTGFGFGASTSSLRRFLLRTITFQPQNDSAQPTTSLGVPSSPGWYLVVGWVDPTTLNLANVKYWRNGDSNTRNSAAVKWDVSLIDQVGLGAGPGLTLADHSRIPSCGYAWGLGDPTSLQSWAYNSGDLRKIWEYDFDNDAGCTLEQYWIGARVDDETPFNISQVTEGGGSTDAWTEVGDVEWTDASMPWGDAGIAAIQSATIENANRDQIIVVATLPSGVFTASPTIGISETDFDLWTTRGFGPIRISSASSVVSGNQITTTLTLNRDIYASESVFFKTAGTWIDDGVNIGAIESGTVTNNSLASDPATATGISFGKIALGFSAARAVGWTQENLGYVVDTGSGVTINDTYPSPTTGLDENVTSIGLRDLHGGMKNPEYHIYEHGYDGRNYRVATPDLKYQDDQNDAKNSLPLSLTTHDSFVKVRSNLNNGSENGGTASHSVYLEEAWGIHVVSSAPGANDFAPPLVGYDGTSARPTMSFDVSAAATALPSYSTSSHSRPPVAEVAERVLRFNPIAGQIGSVEDRRHMTPSGITDEDGYGLNMAQTMNAAGLCLIGDDDDSEKEDIVIGLAASGWQWYNSLDAGGTSIGADGGHNQYHPFPMILAKYWKGESAANIGDVATEIPANLFGQTSTLDAAQVTAVTTPHGTAGETLPKDPNDDLPYASHRRTVSGVSGNVVTMSTAQEAEMGSSPNTNPKIDYNGMLLERESDGYQTEILSTDYAGRSYTVADAGTLSSSDTVFVVPNYTPVAGDFEWALLGSPGNGDAFGPSASYRSLNQWTGMAITLQAMGLSHANFSSFLGYVERANEANNPTGADYPDHHSTYFRGPNEPQSPLFYSWDEDFWDEHWSTISGVASTI